MMVVVAPAVPAMAPAVALVAAAPVVVPATVAAAPAALAAPVTTAVITVALVMRGDEGGIRQGRDAEADRGRLRAAGTQADGEREGCRHEATASREG